MKIRTQLLALVAVVALAPLAISGVWSQRLFGRALDEKLVELHEARAQTAAATARASLEQTIETVALLVTHTVRWNELTAEERQGAVHLVYDQQPDLAVATLLDSDGRGVGDGVFRLPGNAGSHPAVTMDGLSSFAQRIPFAEARRDMRAMGSVADGSLLPMAFASSDRRWVVAVGLSLARMCSDITRERDGISMRMLDERGRDVCGAGVPSGDVLTASAPIGRGWSIATAQPRRDVFATSRALQRRNMLLLALSVVVAIGGGRLLARRIERPIGDLSAGADRLSAGDYQHPIRHEGFDEFGRLGATFNQMAREIERREIEIRTFNTELQRLVEERTRELQLAQEQLLRSKKIAAVSSLGAGIAHEINNPLTSVLGFAQLLRGRATREGRPKDAEALATVEKEALRISAIVQALLSFSQGYGGADLQELDLRDVVDMALARAELAGNTVEWRRPDVGFAVLGRADQLQEALVQLLKNAFTAVRGAGGVEVRASVVDEVARIDVIDTGKGIAPENVDKVFDPFFTTKDEPRAEGLGLTLVHRVMEEHHGRVQVKSVVAKGTTISLFLPLATRRSHLV